MTNIYFQKTYQRAFGTFPLDGQVLIDSILEAAKVGYRAFDTAQMYDNELATGEALKKTSIPRNELCITTKVHPDHFREDAFLPSVKKSLQALQVDFVDVLLVHWPPADNGDITLSLQLLEQAALQGYARYIGVSNYNCDMLRKISNIITTPIVTNQVEFHPLLDQSTLLACANTLGIALSSYCSIARGEIFQHPEFTQIAKKYGKTEAQVALRWIIQKGVSINTMSTNPSNIRNNFAVMDFTLSSCDMAALDTKSTTNYRIVTKNIAPWAPRWD